MGMIAMPENSRGRLLFVTLAMPATGGNGLAMRAGNLLEALSVKWDVHLLVLAVGGVENVALEPALQPFAAKWRELPYGEMLDPAFVAAANTPVGPAQCAAFERLGRPRDAAYRNSAVDAAYAAFSDMSFDVVFVLRQYMAPLAARFLDASPRPLSMLDCDDDDVETRLRFARVLEQYGQTDGAQLEAVTAQLYAAWEKEWLPRFDIVLAASPVDSLRISDRNPDVFVDVMPNVVRAPLPGDGRTGAQTGPLLLVGNLSYLPNVDAVITFCRNILPLIRAQDPALAEVVVAGSNPVDAVRVLADQPGVTVLANPPEIAPLYAKARAAVVPLRAGGGTQIKILEAFAHGVPVISTSLGAEGLDVEAGRHLVVADTPEAFAAACIDIARDDGLRSELVTQARQLQETEYSIEALRARFRNAA